MREPQRKKRNKLAELAGMAGDEAVGGDEAGALVARMAGELVDHSLEEQPEEQTVHNQRVALRGRPLKQ